MEQVNIQGRNSGKQSQPWIYRQLSWLWSATLFAYKDVKNFLTFRKEMKELANDPRSKFSQFGLQVSKFGNIIFRQVVIEESRFNVMRNDPFKINQHLKDLTQPIHDYLFVELLWNEYLITDFIEFTDDDGKVSRCYGVTYTFKPIAISNPKLYWYWGVVLGLVGLCVLPFLDGSVMESVMDFIHSI